MGHYRLHAMTMALRLAALNPAERVVIVMDGAAAMVVWAGGPSRQSLLAQVL
jgi:hypothetical protein